MIDLVAERYYADSRLVAWHMGPMFLVNRTVIVPSDDGSRYALSEYRWLPRRSGKVRAAKATRNK